MGYDRGDNFPLDFEPNGIPFGSKSNEKVSPRSYPIQCERKWKYSFLSVAIFILLFYVWRHRFNNQSEDRDVSRVQFPDCYT